jgi:surfeit locus 1 family protein
VAGAARRIALALLALVLFAGFTALGTWQVARLQWKTALIERVNTRVHQAPVPAPGPRQWAGVSRDSHEYLRVRLSGRFLLHLSTPVQAVTELGPGFWVVTPLRRDDGTIVLVNRGYVPRFTPEQGDSAPVEVTGLLRITEPGGGFLRENDPVANKWYSRDVQAIARARGLSGVAPYFVDAGAGGAGGGPVGGLTVISFPNSHLVYALTWYALAAMTAGVYFWLRRQNQH